MAGEITGRENPLLAIQGHFSRHLICYLLISSDLWRRLTIHHLMWSVKIVTAAGAAGGEEG
jgi:hypothetical protein